MFGRSKHRRSRHCGWLRAEALEARYLLTVPDFALSDLNPTSDTFSESVSPRDYMGQVSGWYFGHAT
jgi:hypothetical protein